MKSSIRFPSGRLTPRRKSLTRFHTQREPVFSDGAANFIEDIFNNEPFRHVNSGDRNIVDELNIILRQDNLPYTMTHFVSEDVEIQSGTFQGHMGHQVRSYPKVILKESE